VQPTPQQDLRVLQDPRVQEGPLPGLQVRLVQPTLQLDPREQPTQQRVRPEPDLREQGAQQEHQTSELQALLVLLER
jgi:hypothetical protein